jgi:hypothetical protein
MSCAVVDGYTGAALPPPVTPGTHQRLERVDVCININIPLANPSAAPLTPSAAMTLDTSAATAATKTEDLILMV